MKIFEVAGDSSTPSPDQLLGLVQFLAGRAGDTNGPKQIGAQAFVNLAQSLDINININNLEEIVGQPPLSGVLEPFDPTTNQIVFKGAEQSGPTQMPVNKAQDIVAAAAKSAMKRDR
jgi:hypothetical protein